MPESFMLRVWTAAPLAFALSVLLSAQTATSLKPIAKPTPTDRARGKQLFEGQCARCHGIGGTGGFGPSLVRPKLRHAPDDDALVAVIHDGIPGTPMGLQWTLSDREIAQVASYVRALGRLPVERIPGDPAKGKLVYVAKGACSTCHIIRGEGGNLGPDLTDIGSRRGAGYLKQSILEPGAKLPELVVPYEPLSYPAYLPVRAILSNGTELNGLRVNEDSFTIQIRDSANQLYSLRKSELQSLEKKPGTSQMPGYQGAFSEAEVDDLVAYLAGLREP